ncbi:unnamed protein product [Hermetia illucens]|uniref:Arrestin C-terminal-like domain-containing protein n=1 Tax=Hermetia illucens TaxID=343691 RepID=A0A7R8V875_HERIL|nr:arrestin domain-containing protein 3-like [Hermetia illucens]CAD7093280.1 unnamed protein product [Hermetia illucens]
MSTECTIRFDNNPHGVYYSGQLVSGACELVTTKQKTIRAIYITINGFAQVRWTESRSRKTAEGKSENYIETFRGDEQYLSSRTVVLGQDTGNFFELHPGKYVYPFQIQLPPHVPTSYNGFYGQIRYEVNLAIDRPWKYDNIFRQPFTVISPLDLNTNPIYRAPVEKKEEKQFCCGTCFYFKNDPIVLNADIPYSAFAPGQNIDFKIFVGNESNVDCREVKIKLVQTTEFSTRTPEAKHRTESMKVAEKKLGAVLKLSRKEYKDFLKIPAVAPSSLETCSIIKVKYTLEINVKIAGLHTNMNISVPVTIGTIPLAGTVAGGDSVITMQPQANGQRDGQPPPYSSIAPPAYEEATHSGKLFVDKDEEEKYGKALPFVPKYPVYHSPNAPTSGPIPPTIGHTTPSKPPANVPAAGPTPEELNLGIIPNPAATTPGPIPMYPPVPPADQPSSPPKQPDVKPRPIGWNA